MRYQVPENADAMQTTQTRAEGLKAPPWRAIS